MNLKLKCKVEKLDKIKANVILKLDRPLYLLVKALTFIFVG